jgi:diadenosine tetraphosphate (Ap4A) HIT family hydrolase
MKCRFCDFDLSQAALSTEHFFALADRAPATKGHTLAIPQKHHETFLTLSREEWADLHAALGQTKKHLDTFYKPDGYNIGINQGEAAGQTVPHLHFHVIPRYAGDTETPRGGVRNILKPLEELWPE